MNDEQLAEIRQRVQGDYESKVAWVEWTQAEKDRARLLGFLDDLLRATPNTAADEST